MIAKYNVAVKKSQRSHQNKRKQEPLMPENTLPDLAEPFDLPWGIEQITLEQGKAKIRY